MEFCNWKAAKRQNFFKVKGGGGAISDGKFEVNIEGGGLQGRHSVQHGI